MRKVQPTDVGYAEFRAGLRRRAGSSPEVKDVVSEVLKKVRAEGDQALLDLTARFDGVTLKDGALQVDEKEFREAVERVSEGVKEAVATSLANIDFFAKRSLREDWMDRNAQGVEVGERFRPFQRVGIYVPGGKAPLVSTVLMTGGFARAAGVPEIVAVTPPGPDGKVNRDLLYALHAIGVREVYKVGGAQAVAALAFGTETISAVDKIFGPGNRYVVEAKRQVLGDVAIDLLPGPSEVLVVADDSARPAFIAADLLAQAEHGPGGEVGFITDSKDLLEAVDREVDAQLADLPRRDIAERSLEEGGFLMLVDQLAEAVELANDFAPEHLSLVVRDEERWLSKVSTAGATYVGSFAAVAVGDFLAGPSHTLPTGGAGRSFSGLRADQFQRRMSVVRMDRQALAKSQQVVETFAEMEGLAGHGRSVSRRLESHE